MLRTTAATYRTLVIGHETDKFVSAFIICFLFYFSVLRMCRIGYHRFQQRVCSLNLLVVIDLSYFSRLLHGCSQKG